MNSISTMLKRMADDILEHGDIDDYSWVMSGETMSIIMDERGYMSAYVCGISVEIDNTLPYGDAFLVRREDCNPWPPELGFGVNCRCQQIEAK